MAESDAKRNLENLMALSFVKKKTSQFWYRFAPENSSIAWPLAVYKDLLRKITE